MFIKTVGIGTAVVSAISAGYTAFIVHTGNVADLGRFMGKTEADLEDIKRQLVGHGESTKNVLAGKAEIYVKYSDEKVAILAARLDAMSDQIGRMDKMMDKVHYITIRLKVDKKTQ
jgi:rRNA processing protein Krr1/Pno1